jgi:glycosyltransferase involved in cell wall biosynthesis
MKTEPSTARHIKRVFIADPSFQDWLGHHAPYDLAVREGLKRAGVETIILANKVVTIEDTEIGKSVDRVFSRTAWGVKTGKFKIRKISHNVLLLFRCVLLYLITVIISPLAFLYIVPRIVLKSCYLIRQSIEKLRNHGKFCKGIFGIYIILNNWVIPRFIKSPFGFLKELLKQILPPVVIVLSKTITPSIKEIYPPHWAAWLLARSSLRDYYELVEALDKHGFGSGDVVFAHMITGAALPVWGLFASRLSRRKKSGELVLLFRYICDWMSPDSIYCKMNFRLLEMAFLSGKLRGATDSSLLAEEYAKYLAVPLSVYPIPHVPSFSIEKCQVPGDRPLRCVSLGNARAEKGIIEIIEAIKLVNDRGFGKNLFFNLQVNDPDEFCREGINKFMKESPANVKFFISALSAPDYDNLLNDADIVLTPYRNDVYFSRTSGVMLEALSAGKIIISTTGTWMEKELIRFDAPCELVPNNDYNALAEALCRIAACPEQYLSKAPAVAKKAREFHNSEVLAENLLHGPIMKNIRYGDKILICYPFSNLIDNKAGNSKREEHLASILRDFHLTFFVPQQIMSGQTKRPLAYNIITYNETCQTLYVLLVKILTALFRIIDTADPILIQLFKKYHCDRQFRLLLVQSLLDKQAVIVEYPFHMREIAPYAKGLGLPLVMSAHDRHAVTCQNPLQYKLIDGWEKNAARLADILFTVAPSEYEYFKEEGIKNILSPSTTDVIGLKEKTTNTEQNAEIILRKAGLRAGGFLLFIGSSNDPNHEAKKRVKKLALLAKSKGLAWHFVIAGGCASPNESTENVHALGLVDQDLLCALYSRCSLVVSPLPGGTGASVKTVEAMGIGKVVFGSRATFRGLQVTDGKECFIEDDLDKYIPRLEVLLRQDSADLLQAVAIRAEEFAERYDYRVCMKPYVDFLRDWPMR